MAQTVPVAPAVQGITRRSFLRTAGYVSAGTLGAVAAARVTGQGWGLVGDALGGVLGATTSFGTVAILRAERSARVDAPGHGGHARAAGTEPANHTWGEVVALQMQVRNTTEAPVLVSPGQLRLRIGSGGPSVTPRAAERDTGAVAPGATEDIWVTFLAPSDAQDVAAEFSDPWQDQPVPLALPVIIRTSSGAHHG